MTAAPAIDLDALLRRLHLPTVRRLYPDLTTRAESEDMAYRDYLAILMAEEVAHRAQTRIQRCVRRAHFPFLKTIDEYDFTFQSAVRLSLLGSALGPEFVTAGHSLVLSGPSGTGKTHLAVAIAYRAIQNGFDAVFTTATALIGELSLASRRGRLRHVLTTYTHPHVLVIDEMGYLSYGPDAANVLFQVVNDRYLHQRPMIFTTNKPLAAWGPVLHDPDLAEAILDRVLERGRHIELRGRSYRTRHAPLDLKPGAESPSAAAARISGNDRPEFSEPAPSLGGWARSADAARARVDAGFRNFLAGLEPMLLHFCVRRFLCAPGQGYYITDFSKGAMLVKRAGVARAERYRRWFSLLEEEIDLVAAPGARIIAVGKTVADALRGYRLQRPFTKVMHYSPLAAKSRAVRVMGLERQFEEFERTVSHADVLATTRDVLTAAGVPPSIYEDAESIVRKARLTTSHRRLIFAYKLAFEQLRI